MLTYNKESFNSSIKHTNQTISAKVYSQEGNSLDYLLRFKS